MLLTRIDRYLLVLYFRTLIICFACVTSLLIVIHLFGNLEDFQVYADQNEIPFLKAAFSYYKPFTLSVYDRLSAVLALLALLFTVGWLHKTNELTALLAAGIAKRRIARPLIGASIAVILSATVLREAVVPLYQDQLDRSPSDMTGQRPRPIRPAFDSQSMCLIQGSHLLPAMAEIVDMSVRVQGGPLFESVAGKIAASKGVYRHASSEHPAGYLLTDVQTPKNIDSRPSVTDPKSGGHLLMTRHDHAWLQPNSCFLVSSIEYEMLRGGSSWQQFASTPELIAHLRAERTRYSGNELRSSIHQRLVRPAIDWTIMLLGIPILLHRPDRHLFFVAGVSLAVVGGFTAFVMGLSALGVSGYLLSPQLATWLPLIIFLPLGWVKTWQALES